LVLGFVLFAIGGFLLWFALYLATRDPPEAPALPIAVLVGIVATFFLLWGGLSMIAIESHNLSVRVAAASLVVGLLPYSVLFGTPAYAVNATLLLTSASNLLCLWLRRRDA
jgi:hypothetical protein